MGRMDRMGAETPPNGVFSAANTWFWPQTLYAYHKNEQVFVVHQLDGRAHLRTIIMVLILT